MYSVPSRRPTRTGASTKGSGFNIPRIYAPGGNASDYYTAVSGRAGTNYYQSPYLSAESGQLPDVSGLSYPSDVVRGGGPLSMLTSSLIPRAHLSSSDPLFPDESLSPPPPSLILEPEEQLQEEAGKVRGGRVTRVQLSAPPPTSHDRHSSAERRALFSNSALSFQRVLSLLLRFPSLILILIGLCSLFGRSVDVKDAVGQERNTATAAISAGGVVLVCSLFLLSHHHWVYSRARFLGILRHVVAVVALTGSAAVLVLGAFSVKPLSGILKNQPFCQDCFSPTERNVNNAVLLGAASLMFMLAAASILLGCCGVYKMTPQLAREKARAEETSKAIYSNPFFNIDSSQ